jgi:hypothetical protein
MKFKIGGNKTLTCVLVWVGDVIVHQRLLFTTLIFYNVKSSRY